jgi:hypothetical protein
MRLFESQFRNLIRQLLIEGKVDVLQARHPHIDVHSVAVLDPTPQKKYLQWMIGQYDQNDDIDDEEMMFTIRKFHAALQRLPSDKRDINQYKSLEAVKTILSQIGDVSKSQQKRTAKSEGAQHVGTVNGYDVYFITSHEAVMLLGSGTKWCITESNGRHWNSYVKYAKFFFAIRNQPRNKPEDKIAFACYLTDDNIQAFDAVDNTIHEVRMNIQLYDFIQSIKDRYKDYIAISQNRTIIIKNNVVESIKVVEKNAIEWYNKNGQLHREDGPAVEWTSGTKEWYKDGGLHREDGPAVVAPSGEQFWYQNNIRHRIGGPAVDWANGNREWYKDGKLHREDGPAVEKANGHREWWLNGKQHRENGPAMIEPDGSKWWFQNGELHHENGPAYENTNGYKEWWLNNHNYSEKQFKELINKS